MTRLTDEEIEKAADASFTASAFNNREFYDNPNGYEYTEGFEAGARWALSQVTALEWKRPEEELPEEDISVLLYFDWQGERDVCVGTYTEGFWLHDAKWSEDVKVLAWCCISLPEWLEEK